MKRQYQGDWRKGREVQARALAAQNRMAMAYDPMAPAILNRNRQIIRSRPYIQGERKYFDSLRSGFALTSSATQTAGLEADPATTNTLFAPTQGDDISNREGRNVYVYSITIKGSLTTTAATAETAADTCQGVRMILCIDKQTNGAQMNSEDLITSSNPGTFNFQNTQFFGRFRILKDKTYTFPPTPIAANGTAAQIFQGSVVKYFKIKHKFAVPLRVNFNATNGGTVADIVDNSFHLIAGRDKADPGVTLNYQCRVSFKG